MSSYVPTTVEWIEGQPNNKLLCVLPWKSMRIEILTSLKIILVTKAPLLLTSLGYPALPGMIQEVLKSIEM